MSGERRGKARIVFDDVDERFGGMRSAYAVVKIGDERVLGKVVDLSESGLRVLFDRPEDVLPTADMILDDVLLGTARLHYNLDCLRVTRAQDEGDGHVSLVLVAENELTRASLWKIYNDIVNIKRAENYAFEPPPKEHLRVPGRGHYSEAARLERLQFIREWTDYDLDTISETKLVAERLTGNIENLVGSVEIPVGLAGPLWFTGEHAKGLIYAPMATTEGALVASASRGARAISLSGGVYTRVLDQRMFRVPVFDVASMEAAHKLSAWIQDHFEELRAQTRLVSRHARLTEVIPQQMGRRVHVTFVYRTGDAAGQNMTTCCTWKACQWIIEQMEHFPSLTIEDFYIEGNRSGDKKVNFQSMLQGRGSRVTAECFIQNDVLVKVLGADAQSFQDGFHDLMLSSIGIGAIGFNCNIANVIAAIFAATGQDIASVHESSLGLLRVKASPDGLYASMILPALIVGTVGGGTGLPNQRNYLEMIDCAGPGRVSRLAEIIAGYCLALDLSTSAAIATGQFVSAHNKLGRSRPVEFFADKDLTTEFFEGGFKRVLGDDGLSVVDVEDAEIEMGSSIISCLTAQKVKKLAGLVPKSVTFEQSDGQHDTIDVVVKVKPLDEEAILVATNLARMCAGAIATAYPKFVEYSGAKACHTRELALCSQTDERFVRNVPTIYECHSNAEREAYVIVMEDLSPLELLNTADDPSGWTREHIEEALRGAAELQSIWFGREEELKEMPWIGTVMTAEIMESMKHQWKSMGVHAWSEFPEWFTEEELESFQRLVESVSDWWSEIDALPKTLIHNDFNPRNLAFRGGEGGELRLCAYDWELATIHIPQRDLAELLAFVLSADASMEDVTHYVEFHRQALERYTGTSLDAEQWRRGYALSLRDFMVNRLAHYMMANTFQSYAFLERVVGTLRQLFLLERGQ